MASSRSSTTPHQEDPLLTRLNPYLQQIVRSMAETTPAPSMPPTTIDRIRERKRYELHTYLSLAAKRLLPSSPST